MILLRSTYWAGQIIVRQCPEKSTLTHTHTGNWDLPQSLLQWPASFSHGNTTFTQGGPNGWFRAATCNFSVLGTPLLEVIGCPCNNIFPNLWYWWGLIARSHKITSLSQCTFPAVAGIVLIISWSVTRCITLSICFLFPVIHISLCSLIQHLIKARSWCSCVRSKHFF